MKPLFVLGSKAQADVAAKGGKVVAAESYKEALLSAGSEKGGRKEVTGLTADKISFLAYGKVEGKYDRSSKRGQSLLLKSWNMPR